MRRIIILAVILVACSGSVSAESDRYWPGFVNGNMWRDWPLNVRISYIFGTVDGFLYSNTFGANENITGLIQNCLADNEGEQMLAIVEQYMRDHPDNWNEGMNHNVWWAIYDVCFKA